MAAIESQATPSIAQRKTDASDWFRMLRDEICAVFEAIEDAGQDDDVPAGRYLWPVSQSTAQCQQWHGAAYRQARAGVFAYSCRRYCADFGRLD